MRRPARSFLDACNFSYSAPGIRLFVPPRLNSSHYGSVSSSPDSFSARHPPSSEMAF